MADLIDKQTLQKNAAVDQGLMKALRQQTEALARLFGDGAAHAYNLAKPLENPMGQCSQPRRLASQNCSQLVED